ncbi:hypothetical protein FB567DRAFT_88766 [Paraphoma chrysanthemicola]|uniref:Uncharacterized protein n=1 Tax=Paraphoma chrysanthemicola TaxID=798071 RepID=A0A8K0R3G4_9PLEO|nr:hypothetical protein FB567DRAFT_88766 [Paraphoma chrysanthemicola]
MPSRASQPFWYIPLAFLPAMAPHPIAKSLSQIESWTSSHDSGNFFKILLFISIVATAIKSYAVLVLRRKRRLDNARLIQEKEADSCRTTTEKQSLPSEPEVPHQHLHALRQELSQPDLNPVFPWIAPPTPLPGPYDAPYYPLPNIRRDSHDASDLDVEKNYTVPYTRRISMNGIRAHESTLCGTTTVSNHGWRRTQWTVATG